MQDLNEKGKPQDLDRASSSTNEKGGGGHSAMEKRFVEELKEQPAGEKKSPVIYD